MSEELWRQGTVVLTGANGHVGRAVRRRLQPLPNRVVALTREDDWCAPVRHADAVIHLAGTLQPRGGDSYQAANVGTVRRWLDAVGGSTLQRVVLLSYLGADPASPNAYLRAKGEAEALVRGCGGRAVVIRAPFIYGDPDDIGPSFTAYQRPQGGSVSVLGDGRQQLTPIHVDDLAELLVRAALDVQAPTGVHEVGGPERLTLDEFVALLNPAGVRLRHLPPALAKLLARVSPRLTPDMVQVLLADSSPTGDPVATAAGFGVALHPVAETLASRRADRVGPSGRS